MRLFLAALILSGAPVHAVDWRGCLNRLLPPPREVVDPTLTAFAAKAPSVAKVAEAVREARALGARTFWSTPKTRLSRARRAESLQAHRRLLAYCEFLRDVHLDHAAYRGWDDLTRAQATDVIDTLAEYCTRANYDFFKY